MERKTPTEACGDLAKISGQFWCEKLNRPLQEIEGAPYCPSDCPKRIAQENAELAALEDEE